MKYILTCIFIMLMFEISFGQVDTILGDNFIYEEVYQCNDQSKEQLYEKSREWVIRYLKSSDNLIDFDKEEKNRIIVSGSIIINPMKRPRLENRFVSFKLSLYFKEGRIKYILDNIIHSGSMAVSSGLTVVNKTYTDPIDNLQFAGIIGQKRIIESVENDVDLELRKLIKSYKTHLISNQSLIDEDW